jgi:hypothetical protein
MDRIFTKELLLEISEGVSVGYGAVFVGKHSCNASSHVVGMPAPIPEPGKPRLGSDSELHSDGSSLLGSSASAQETFGVKIATW